MLKLLMLSVLVFISAEVVFAEVVCNPNSDVALIYEYDPSTKDYTQIIGILENGTPIVPKEVVTSSDGQLKNSKTQLVIQFSGELRQDGNPYIGAIKINHIAAHCPSLTRSRDLMAPSHPMS